MSESLAASLTAHLWQSTFVTGVVWLATLALRTNRPRVRYWLWTAASVKFLVPFSWLVSLGGQFEWRTAPPFTQPAAAFVMEQVLAPRIVAVAPLAAVQPVAALPWVLASIWVLGCCVVLVWWWRQWRPVRTALRDAKPIALAPEYGVADLAVWSSPSTLEPGVVGVWHPILLLPDGLAERLTSAQLKAVIAHERCHIRCHDNLAAAVHMLVEALFWFHPLVWWLERRLIDERELACDEEVLRLGNEPTIYAESILRTCEFSVESPLVCIAGVTGSDLKIRIEGIMRGRTGIALHAWKKLLLGAAAITALAGPIGIGVLNAPPLGAQTQTPASAATPKFEVASIKPNKSGDGPMRIGMQPGGRFTATNVPLRSLIRNAYQLQDFQIVGGPDWIASDRFDIVARAETDIPLSAPGTVGPTQMMMRSLLEERFKLVVHQEQRDMPIFALVLARNDRKLGPKLTPSTVDCQAMMVAARASGVPPPPPPPGERPPCGMRTVPGRLMGGGFPLSQLASSLSLMVQRTVVDGTGLTGNYDLELIYTPDQLPQGTPPPGAPAPPPIDPNGPSIFTALQEQLGLKLESQRGPVGVLVIDSVEKPTPD